MPDTAFFRPELFEFLRQLKRHNYRDWFAKNKARYHEAVLEPALLFIGSFAPHLAKLSPFFVADPRPARGSLFRIYRDTRFSLDKRPFKAHVGIRFSHAAGKDAHAPIFYLHLEPENCFAAAGVWHPDNRLLTSIRTAIVDQPERWAGSAGSWNWRGIALRGRPTGTMRTIRSSRTSSGRISWRPLRSETGRSAGQHSCGILLPRAWRWCRWSNSRRRPWALGFRLRVWGCKLAMSRHLISRPGRLRSSSQN